MFYAPKIVKVERNTKISAAVFCRFIIDVELKFDSQAFAGAVSLRGHLH